MAKIGRPSRPLADRFWEKVQKTDGCWLWEGAVRKNGYGAFQVGIGVTVGAHRMAFELTSGEPIPEGVFVLHRCDVRHCVRPDHLWLGTPADNMRDMAQKGRSASGDKHGARLHPESRPRGENNKKAKLQEADVVQIRRAYAKGGVTHEVLGSRHGISQAQVQRIVARTSWSHVTDNYDED